MSDQPVDTSSSQESLRSGNADFDHPFASISERDVDFLLVEEFATEPSFVSWFCQKLSFTNVVQDGVWHSVINRDGETDILLRVLQHKTRVGILIENKIAAIEQDHQDERYHLRGIFHQSENKYDRYVTVICAPQRYLDGLDERSQYQFRISYEEIADWLGKQTGLRAAWRHKLITAAIEQGRRGYTMQVDTALTAFHHDYWEEVRRKFPSFMMEKPGPKGPSSNWIILRCPNFPKGVRLNHKLGQCIMELSFDRSSVQDIRALRADWPANYRLIQKGSTATIELNVPRVDTDRPISEQSAELDRVFVAASALAVHANIFTMKD
jgi:hypothetical protein